MKLLISTQSTVEFDGTHYYGNSVKAMWNRYHFLGDQCRLICHIKNVERPTQDMIDGNVELIIIRKINSIKAIFQRYSSDNDRIAREQVSWADFCIIHVPNDNGYQVIRYCKKYKKPYMTVVCGCSWDALWNHGWQGKLLAPKGYYTLRKAQKDAPYSIYVTNEFLQNRYPTNGESIGCSNVNIHTGDKTVLDKRLHNIQERQKEGRRLKIGTAAAIDVAYKGQEYVIRAIAELKKQGINYEYHLIGRGDSGRLKGIAEDSGVSENVFFHGAIPHDEVLAFLDEMDIYVQPSKQEGLPRSLIEAMSRGCLCLGSKTAGIPELLEPRYVFPKGNVNTIVSILKEITSGDFEGQANRNFEKAKEYDVDLLNNRRNTFLMKFKNEVLK